MRTEQDVDSMFDHMDQTIEKLTNQLKREKMACSAWRARFHAVCRDCIANAEDQDTTIVRLAKVLQRLEEEEEV